MRNLFFLLILFGAFYSCSKETPEETLNSSEIYLLDQNDRSGVEKSIILYDKNDYLIETVLDTFLNGYPFNIFSDYSEMKFKAIEDSKVKSELNVTNYLKYKNDSVYILANYLEKGNCFVFDKSDNKYLTRIKMENYMKGEPMASSGGRRFYLKGKLFLETVDLISKK